MRRFLLLLVAAAAVAAFLAWPRLNSVETGKTPEYPDLQPREYAAGEEQVTRAVKAAIGRLSGFELVGGGSGRGGSEIQAVATPAVLHFKHDVSVRIRREGGKTKVGVKSRSEALPIDFGQNARNVRELLAALDQELGAGGAR